jgi:hypothetical protein
MDLALTINGWIDEEVIFAQQIGARHVFARVDSSQGQVPNWDAPSLSFLANRIEKAGLVLAGLHAAGTWQEGPSVWAAHLIQEAGTAGIGLLSLSAAFFPARRYAEKPILALLTPLAEAAARAGVKLAIPAALLVKDGPGGLAILASVLQSLPPSAGLEGSPGLLLKWLEDTDPGSNSRKLIQDRLCLVSFENGRRSAGKLSSAGIDELLPLCWRLRQTGYPGLIRLGKLPQWKGDTREGHHARAFTTGYLRAVLQAFQRIERAREAAPR